MRKPIIRSIDSLKDLHVFPDDSSVSDSPRLHKHNLVYGFNGCGKTTLSRVFSCLGTGRRHEEWSSESKFTVTLSDGDKVKSESVDDELAQRIVVFNTDFIADSFRWNQGEANPIFYIGHHQNELAQKVNAKINRFERVDGRLRRVASILGKSEQSLAQHRRDRARLIANELELGRQYVATNLDVDYGAYQYSDSDFLDESSIKAQREAIKLDDPLPKLPFISEESSELGDLIRDVRSLLQRTIGTISIDALREHDEMLTWAKSGLEYHKEHDLRSCLLCGNVLTNDRVRLLEDAIDDRYDVLISEVARSKKRAEAIRGSLVQLKSVFPSKNDVISSQHRSFIEAAYALRSCIEEGQKQIEQSIELLAKKLDYPNSQVALDVLLDSSGLGEWMSRYTDKAKAFNKVINAHNTEHDDFKSNQNAAKDKLKKHYLAEGYEEYHKLASNVAKGQRIHDVLEDRSGELKATIDAFKRKMRQHGPAADHVNAMIYKYLGHKELEIVPKDEGYEIRRNGKATTAAPSEGEKTAIALSYFLVLVEADGRKREDLIVVMDDPISSLDTRSLNYACSLIKSLGNIAQLIILTHNAHVLNELKKWLRKGTEKEVEKRGKSKEDATSALLFIDTVQPDRENSRRSRIVGLPKYLRDYESEYHFLFHMALRFLGSEEDRANYFFAMPNVLRKILEVFLAFKRPGADGLSSKIDSLAKQESEVDMDEVRVRALERLAHVESHGDNIDDLVTASSMTIEETKDAAEALLELIEKMDPEHNRRMRKQCGFVA